MVPKPASGLLDFDMGMDLLRHLPATPARFINERH